MPACRKEGNSFGSLTVRENLELGTYSLPNTVRKRVRAERLEMVFSLFAILKNRLKQRAETLSGGEQQMLAMGRALMANPKLLASDEPSLGLAPMLVSEMMSTLRRICDEWEVSLLARGTECEGGFEDRGLRVRARTWTSGVGGRVRRSHRKPDYPGGLSGWLMAQNSLNKEGRGNEKAMIIITAICVAVSFLRAGLSEAQTAPYVIGAVIDLTGRQSNLGIGNKTGLDIAIESINAAGGVNGRQLKVVVYDSESDTAKGVIHTKRLIEVDKAVVLAGYNSSATSLSCIQTVEAGKTPMFASAPADKIWKPTKKWVFNVVPRQKEASIPILLQNLQQRGAKKIAYIYIDTAYGQTGKATFDEACKEMNITPAIVEKYAPGSTDAGPQITHIKAAGADGLLITGNVPDTAMVIKSARELGFTGIIVSDYAIVGPEFIELAGKNGEGIVSTSLKTLVAPDLPDSDPQKKVTMDLYTKYTKQYGAFSLYAGHTWDQAYMIAEALKKVDPKLDPSKDADLVKIREQIRDNIEQIKNFVGAKWYF